MITLFLLQKLQAPVGSSEPFEPIHARSPLLNKIHISIITPTVTRFAEFCRVRDTNAESAGIGSSS